MMFFSQRSVNGCSYFHISINSFLFMIHDSRDDYKEDEIKLLNGKEANLDCIEKSYKDKVVDLFEQMSDFFIDTSNFLKDSSPLKPEAEIMFNNENVELMRELLETPNNNKNIITILKGIKALGMLSTRLDEIENRTYNDGEDSEFGKFIENNFFDQIDLLMTSENESIATLSLEISQIIISGHPEDISLMVFEC